MSVRTTEEGKELAGEGRSRWTRWGVLGAVCALVIGVYAWSSNSGILELLASGQQDSYYNLQVRGFQDGHLAVKKEPPPGLTQLDSSALDIRGLHDLSYYKGKLYLYFGVTPALVLFWPYAALTGHYLSHKDAALLFFSAGFLAGAGLLLALWRRYFKETGLGTLAAGMLALGLANLTPVIVGWSDVYEVAISCGYALTMMALAGVWAALHQPGRRGLWLAVASLAYGLAVGARPSLLFGAVILLIPVAQAWRERRAVWPLLLAATIPIATIGLGLMLYNLLRFDSPLDFGDSHQLPLTAKQLFRIRYLWFNFRVGFLEPARWSGTFPYVHDIPALAMPRGYFMLNRPFGVLSSIPLVWLAPAAPLVWRRRLGSERSILRWFLAAVTLLFGMVTLTLCLHDSMALRYELEYASPLVFLAVIGMFGLERALAGRAFWLAVTHCGWGLLLAFSVAFNLCLSFEVQADLHCGYGSALVQMGRVDEAILQYQMALQFKPDHSAAHYKLGTALMQEGRVGEAVSQYQKALEIMPDLADARLDLGTALAVKGDAEGAIVQIQKGLEIKPDDVAARNNLGNVLLAKGEMEEAIAQYQKALEIHPDHVMARNNLGKALLRKGDLDGAMACFQQTTPLSADPLRRWYDLGNDLLQKQSVDAAIVCYQQAIKIAPDFADAYAKLGAALSQKGQIKEAIAAWQRALLEISSDPTGVQINLAWTLATTADASLRDGAKAVALASQANQATGGGDAEILRALAAAYAEEGSFGLAGVTARRALDLAKAQENNALAANLQKDIQLYEASSPVRDGTTEGSPQTGRETPP